MMLLGFCDSHAYQVRVACGRRIGMCGCSLRQSPKTDVLVTVFVDFRNKVISVLMVCATLTNVSSATSFNFQE